MICIDSNDTGNDDEDNSLYDKYNNSLVNIISNNKESNNERNRRL